MNLYEILGLGPDATPAQIKAAYRREAKACHPDAGGTTEAFQNVERAYRILKDPEKRARYDETGQSDDRPDNDEADALSVLASMVEHALSKDDLKHHDLIGDMRKQLNADIKKANENVAEARDYIDRALDARKRLKTKQPALLAMIDQKAGQAQQAIVTLERQAKLRERALEMLADASFEFEPREPQPWGAWNEVDTDVLRRAYQQKNSRMWGGPTG
jgi:curved DNA-binding protein CbpA